MFESIKKNLGELIVAYKDARFIDAAREVGDLAHNAGDLIHQTADLVENFLKPLTGGAETAQAVASAEAVDLDTLMAIEAQCVEMQHLCIFAAAPTATTEENANLDPATILVIVQVIAAAIRLFREFRRRKGS
jgi:hypothetical protein